MTIRQHEISTRIKLGWLLETDESLSDHPAEKRLLLQQIGDQTSVSMTMQFNPRVFFKNQFQLPIQGLRLDNVD